MRISLVLGLALFATAAHADPQLDRATVKAGYSATALQRFDRVQATTARGSVNVMSSPKDHYQALWASAGKRVDSVTLTKGQLLEISTVSGKRSGVDTQYARNYREHPLLGKLLRTETTVRYKNPSDNAQAATLLGQQKRLVIAGFKIPLPTRDGSRILAQINAEKLRASEQK
jgi:hypothetical protein